MCLGVLLKMSLLKNFSVCLMLFSIQTAYAAVTFTTSESTYTGHHLVDLTADYQSWAIFGSDGDIDTLQQDNLGDNVYEKKLNSTIFDTPIEYLPNGCSTGQGDYSGPAIGVNGTSNLVEFDWSDGTNNTSLNITGRDASHKGEGSSIYQPLGSGYGGTKCTSSVITIPINTTAGTIDLFIKNFDLEYDIAYSIGGSTLSTDTISNSQNYKKIRVTFSGTTNGDELKVTFNNYKTTHNNYSNIAFLAAGSDMQELTPLVIVAGNGDNKSASVNIPENTTMVATVRSDPETNVTYSIAGGDDSAKFSIDSSSGVLSFQSPPDYEAPSDTGGDNGYTVIVRANNTIETADYTIYVTVIDINDATAPSITSTAGTTADDGVQYTYTPTVTDSDDTNNGTDLIWSLIGAPSGMVASSTGGVTWTPSGVSSSGTVILKVVDGDGGTDTESFTIAVSSNSVPTLTSFSGTIDTTNEDTEVELTLAEFKAKGNEADSDGTVDGFVVKAVSTGSLKIGTASGTAAVFHATTNNTIDSTNKAYWTPASNANGTLNAFTVVAEDNDGDESTSAVQATILVNDINDVPTLTSFSGTKTR